MKGFITTIHVLISLGIIFVILLQPAKVTGLSKTISGGAETFFGRNKSRTYEGKLQKLTTVLMALFVITSMALVYYSNK